MKPFRAYYEPGNDKSPLASAMEIVDCAMARKGPLSKEDATRVAETLVASMVSIFTAIENIDEVPRDVLRLLLDNLARNNIGALKHLGLTQEEVTQAGGRMLTDVVSAARKEG